MKPSILTKTWRAAAIAAVASSAYLMPLSSPLRAADHGDAPTSAGDQGADIADVYFFLDPVDNTKAVMILTVRGFITAGEASNFGLFDPTVKYRFEIETTDDAIPDKFIDVRFSPRVADSGPAGKEILQVPKAQEATITLVNFKDSAGKKIKKSVTAPATNPSLAATAPPQVVTDVAVGADSIKFFAGETDDPFFFDIPAFGRFIGSIRAGAPDTSFFSRGRDSFAGYNVMSIAIQVPVALIKGDGDVIGLSASTQRNISTTLGKPGKLPKGKGAFKNIDREGLPAVNVALVPFNRKNEYNASTTKDDAKGKFADDIVATLTALGTTGDNIGVLAGLAVTKGDILRVNTTIANTGAFGGVNSEAAFPNGRRVADDVIDTILTVVAGGPVSDNVDGNDVDVDTITAGQQPFLSTFPYVAPSQQPFDAGTLDDNTRN